MLPSAAVDVHAWPRKSLRGDGRTGTSPRRSSGRGTVPLATGDPCGDLIGFHPRAGLRNTDREFLKAWIPRSHLQFGSSNAAGWGVGICM